MPRRLFVAGLLAIAMLFAASAAIAGTPRLVVTRGAGATDCPDAARLSAAVAQLMGHPAFNLEATSEEPAPDAFSVDIQRGGLYTASIHSQGGERDLSDPGPGCAGLADALALTLAILLDPEGRPPPPPPKHDATPKKTVEPLRDPAPAKPRRPPFAALEIGAGLATGIVESASLAVTAAIDLRASSLFSLGIGLVAAPSGTLSFDQGSTALTMIGASLRPCLPELGRVERIRLRGCADLVFGALVADPSFPAAVHASTTTVFWFGAGPAARLDGTIVGPLGWTLGGEALFARPQHFVIAAAPGVNEEQKNLRTVDLLVTAGLRVSIF